MCVAAQGMQHMCFVSNILQEPRQHQAAGRQSSDNKRWQASQNMPRSSRLGQSVAEEALLRHP